eukprot:6681318-Alexandrium_andersonii.AAC.1
MGGLYTPTDIHRADDPTRHRKVRPADRVAPSWKVDLERGCLVRFDLISSADSLPAPLSFWARLLALAQASGG